MQPRDPYKTSRPDQGFVDAEIDEQEFTLILRYEDVKRVTRDWEHFTSATPFRVPIPEESGLRPVPQYPIEADPPEHRQYRRLIENRFSRKAAELHWPAVEALVDRILESSIDGGSIEVVADLALPVVTYAIAATMGFPDDADRLSSWGLDPFKDSHTGQRHKNEDMDRYLMSKVDDALAADVDGIFGDLARAEIEGRHLDRDEILGFGYLMLAGGRDTVIGAIAGALWHLGTDRIARDGLRAHPTGIPLAVEEYLRYFSPLAHIGRTVTGPTTIADRKLDTNDLVALSFASANHDETVFDDPDICQIDRKPNRHVAFGHGPHTCVGAPLARMQISAVLSRFLALVPAFSVLDPLDWPYYDSRTGTMTGPNDRLVLKLG